VATWVCLLRAVNLGRVRKVPMARLREALAAAGMTEVRTVLQSGNVIGQSPLESHAGVSDLVRNVIAAEFSLDVPVVTRAPAEIDDVITGNPFAAEAAKRPQLIRVIFLASVPAADRIEQLTPAAAIRLAGSHLYVDYQDGDHDAGRTAGYFTRVLGVDGTERNWRTVLAIADRCRGRPAE
jgi:uncharacterized protein (DUF1697 family)